MKNKKLILSIGTVALAISPVAIAVSCSSEFDGWTGAKPDTSKPLNLTSAQVGTWHALFHEGGRSIPNVGQKLFVETGGKIVTYTWNEKDANAETPKAYLDKKVAYGPMLSYLAQRMATAEGIDAAAVYAAFGVGGHGINPASMPAASMNGQSTDAKDNSTVQITGEEVAYAIDGVWGWHQLFYAGLPAGGTKIYLPLNSTVVRDNAGKPIKPEYNKSGVATNKPVPAEGYAIYRAHFDGDLVWATAKKDDLLSITWGGKDAASQVAQDYEAGLASQGKIVNYIQNRFIATYPIKMDAIKTYIKENSGGHDIWDELGQSIDRTTPVTLNLSTTSPSEKVRYWHFAFANKTNNQDSTRYGRSLPMIGDTFTFSIGEVTYSFVWDENDTNNVKGWLTNDWNQFQVVEYVAARLMKGNLAAQNQVLLSMSKEHLADGGVGSYPSHWPTVDGASQPVAIINGRDGWHSMFKTGIPAVGQRLSFQESPPRNAPAGWTPAWTYDYTFTKADSENRVMQNYINNNMLQTSVVQYFVEKLKAAVSTDAERAFVVERMRSITGGHLIWQDPSELTLRNKPYNGDATTGIAAKIDLRDGMRSFNYSFNTESGKWEGALATSGTPGVSNAWHNAFALEGNNHTGRTLPLVGDIFKYGEKEYTWTQIDTDYITNRGWLEYRMSIYDVVEFVANKVAGENINTKHGIYDRMTRTTHAATAGAKPASWTRPTGYTPFDLTAKGETGWDTATTGTIAMFKYNTWLRVTAGTTPVNYDVYLSADYFSGYLNKPSAVAPTDATEKAAWIASWKAFIVMVMSDAYNGLTEAAAWTAIGLTKPA